MLFSLLFTHHSVFEGTQWKYSYIAILCYPCYRILYLIYRRSGSRLEEVDQQLSVFLPVPQLVWSVHPRWLFWKTSIISISISSDHRDGGTIRFFSHLKNQTSLYRWPYWNMIWTNEVLFWRYLAVACHKLRYSYLISVEIVVGYRKLRGSQGTQTNLIVLLEKPDITYPSRSY